MRKLITAALLILVSPLTQASDGETIYKKHLFTVPRDAKGLGNQRQNCT